LVENKNIEHQINHDMVFIEKINSKDIKKIENSLSEHYSLTKSRKAERILDNFENFTPKFIKVVPKEIFNLLESKGISIDDFDFVNPKLN
jgi:glutamate synthase (ferredoxin)